MHPSSLHLGPFHIPLFGLCAALGLMATLLLSQRTARLARLDAAAVWDAGAFGVLAALLASRALLVLGNWHSFLAAPLLVLALPTLNDTGLLLTAALLFFYLRRRKLPTLGFLDAMAPCAALVWAFLSLGNALENARDGMPARIWRGGVQPVELYTMVAALLLCGALLRALPRGQQPGHTCALGLGLAGVAVFLLDFLRVPSELFGAAILDPVQWLGLAMLVVGFSLWIALPAAARKVPPDAV